MYEYIYSTILKFVKVVESKTRFSCLCKSRNGTRGPRRKLTIVEVISLNILRFFLHIKNLKAFHRLVKTLGIVPNIPNYENFLKASNKALPIMTLFLNALLAQNRRMNKNDLHFMDSTPVTTCLSRRIYSHKVTKGLASRGKSTKGWFYGFKLRGVCGETGIMEALLITGGKENDGRVVERLTENMRGTFFADAGCLRKSSELKKPAESGRLICASTRKNMRRLVSLEQWSILKKRNIIESDWGAMKQNYFLEYHQARSINGLFRHYVCSISAYILQCRLNSLSRLKTRI